MFMLNCNMILLKKLYNFTDLTASHVFKLNNEFRITNILTKCNINQMRRCSTQHNITLKCTAKDRPQFPGSRSQWTHQMKFIDPNSYEGIPVYRVMNRNGEVIQEGQDPELSKDVLIKMYRGMILLQTMDNVLYEAQRQGRLSFYMASSGEEATHFGPAAALSDKDLVFSQYREAGVLIWRGFGIDNFISQCFGNENDLGKGRQMPIHYGSRNLNYVTIKSTLTSQMLHAVGAAYALKRQGIDRVTLCYFGDGAASEGDAFAAFNFAATLDCPTIFLCRNNGFAISTPTQEQYRGDGIAARGPPLGIPSIRVDGNDIFALYNAVSEARKMCVEDSKPVLIEAMTYRIGHHSTSDDSSAYRSVDEVRLWKQQDHPVIRLRKYLECKNWWSDEQDKELHTQLRKDVLDSLIRNEKILKPNIREMFTDVYDEMPSQLNEQLTELKDHLLNYKQHYPSETFKPD